MEDGGSYMASSWFQDKKQAQHWFDEAWSRLIMIGEGWMIVCSVMMVNK